MLHTLLKFSIVILQHFGEATGPQGKLQAPPQLQSPLEPSEHWLFSFKHRYSTINIFSLVNCQPHQYSQPQYSRPHQPSILGRSTESEATSFYLLRGSDGRCWFLTCGSLRLVSWIYETRRFWKISCAIHSVAVCIFKINGFTVAS